MRHPTEAGTTPKAKAERMPIRASFKAEAVAAALALPLLILVFWACSPSAAPDTEVEADPQQAFWDNLRIPCGAALSGRRTVARPENEMLAGDELLVAHFRECGEETIKIPFHIGPSELRPNPDAPGGTDANTPAAAAPHADPPPSDGWDRSRTWVFTRHNDRLEIRHDHRKPDGTEDDNTWYGGFTETSGTSNVQEFIYYGRQDPDGLRLGWRIEIHPGERFVYGTIRGDDWTWRLEFDLTGAIAAPPAPWGHEKERPDHSGQTAP